MTHAVSSVSLSAPASTPSAAPLAALYTAHHGWLLSLLRRRLGNAADAADLAHDAFIRLLLKPREFPSAEGARAYLSVVAKGLCVDLWRRREIEQAWLDELARQPQALAVSAEEQVAALQALVEIDQMLRRLPARAAEAFVLAMVQGLTDAAIAERLGVSDRMVRKYVAQAMAECLLLQAAGTFAPADRLAHA